MSNGSLLTDNLYLEDHLRLRLLVFFRLESETMSNVNFPNKGKRTTTVIFLYFIKRLVK